MPLLMDSHKKRPAPSLGPNHSKEAKSGGRMSGKATQGLVENETA